MPGGRPAKISFAPPSDRQMTALRARLDACESAEFAALNCGIPKRMLLEWVKLGRMGKPEFVPFVEMLDRANAELAKRLVDPIAVAASEGNLQAIQWLYKARIEAHEKRFNVKMAEIEDAIEEAQAENPVGLSEEDLDAAEARALAAAEETQH